MIFTNKLLPVALIAALIGGSVGALVMHKSQPASAAETTPTAQTYNNAVPNAEPVSNNEMVPAEYTTTGEQTAYKTGFADGFAAATDGQRTVTPSRRSPSRVVYRSSGSRAS